MTKKDLPPDRNRRRRTRTVVFALIILALLALGYGAAQWRAGLADRELREGLLHQARAIARTINPEEVKSLSFTAADKERPEFRRLREQMRAYQTMIPCRGIYTLALRKGELVFGPESYAEDDPQASPPGQIYRQPTPEARAMFQTRRAFTEGPAADEYGTFVSAFAPLLDPRTGEVLLVVGLDVEAADWETTLARARLAAIFWLLLPGVILLGGILALWRQRGLPIEKQTRQRYTEVYLVAAFGLALTLVASLALHDSETRSRRASFRQLALANTGLVLGAFEDLRDHKLDALARFFEGSQDVDQNEFRVFAEPLARGTDIQAMEWIRPVPAARKAPREQQARAAGQADFIIWQEGADRRREPAAGRPVYYPVWYVEPLQGNEAALGYDVGSEPLRRAALVAALETGLPTATDPLVLVQVKGDPTGLLIFRPLFTGKSSARTLRGFALAAVRLQPFLQSALSLGSDEDVPAALDMYQLQTGQPPRLLASSSLEHAVRHRTGHHGEEELRLVHSDFSVLFPLFIFGKSYALLIHPLPAFLAANPLRDGGTTALVGLFLTALLTAFALFLLRRRADLETRVQARTAQLAESEERYRDLVENIHDLICTHDLEGTILSVNQAALKLLGYESGEIIGKNIRDALAPAARPEFDEYLATIRREGAAQGLLLAQTKSGEKRLWEYDNTLRTEGVPRPIVRGLARDVTESRRAEKALRESERRLSQIIEFLPDATFAIDVEGKVTAWNRAMEELTGIKAAEMLGQGDYAYALPFYGKPRPVMIDLALSPDEEIARSYTSFREERGRLESETYNPDFRGMGPQWAWNVAAKLYGPEGQVTGAIESIRLITERKLAEEAQREHNRELTAIYRSAPLIMMLVDAERRVEKVNGTAVEVAGRTAAEMIGLRSGDALRCLHALDDPSGCGFGPFCAECTVRQLVLDTLETGQAHQQVEASLPFSVGGEEQELVFLISTSRIYLREEPKTLVSMMDITDRKRAEEAREQLEVQLRQAQKMEAVGQLAGGVAHDFNNMLNVIIGYAGLAQMKLPPSDPLQTHIQEIMKAAKRAADLVRQLLAFARRQTIAPRVLDLNETVAGMLKMLRRLIGEDIDLLWNPGPDLWPVNMDPTQLDQILANLTVNARDAIAGVGKITIETNNVEFDAAYCRNHAGFIPGQYVLLAVSDDGSGMDKKTLAHLFEPFFTTKPLGEGTGLGLATVYGIVKQNEGFINVYSEPSQGSSFKIYLPRHAAEVAAMETPTGAAPAPVGAETVLLVEDEEALLEIGQIMLTHLGYKVLPAGSHTRALKLAEEYPGEIQLLLTDVVMPQMSGRDLWQRVSVLRPGIKCLYMSGYTANVIAHRGILDEGVHFLQKPFSLDDLALKVREALETPAHD